MVRTNILIGLCLLVLSGFSQKGPAFIHQRDSIQNIIDATQGSPEKIEKYRRAYWVFARNHPSIAIDFANKGLDLAVKSDNYRSQVGFYIKIGQSYVSRKDYDYEKGLHYFYKALQIAKENGLDEGALQVEHRIASVWIKQDRKEEAAKLLDSIVQIAVKHDFVKVEGNVQLELGKLERSRGNYDKSLACFFRNLEIAQTLDNPEQVTYTLLQIATDYDLSGDYKKAIEINHRGFNLCQQIKNHIRANYFNNNLAICYRNLKQYDSAFYFHELVLQKSKKDGNPIALARVYTNMAETYSAATEYNKAIAYFDSAYQLLGQRKGGELNGIIFQNLSSIYQEQHAYRKSINYGLLAFEIANRKEQIKELDKVYNPIYLSYKALRKYDSALYYFELMTSANDSIYNIEKYNSTEHIKREIESAEKQIEIDRLQYESKRDRIILFSAFGAFLSFLLIAFLMVRNHKRKKELAEEHKKLEEQKVLTLIQEQEINAVNSMIKGQEKERKKISDELHDNLGSSLATLKLHIENLLYNKKLDEKGKKEILEKSCGLLDDTYQKVRDMAHVKSTGMVAQKGLVLALEKLGQQISSKGNVEVHIDVFGFEKIASNPLKILLYNTIQELLTNAIKHARASQINIQITRHENELNILVEDNGSGFNFTEKTYESGMGLFNIKNKIEYLKGSFDVDSKVGHGTTININIPI
ncbi:MAG: tetratricopeptide repeat protein [Chlorobi bacterium]|nr:tetratricopeptide repeat protein [Chlorobiota bacterium]